MCKRCPAPVLQSFTFSLYRSVLIKQTIRSAKVYSEFECVVLQLVFSQRHILHVSLNMCFCASPKNSLISVANFLHELRQKYSFTKIGMCARNLHITSIKFYSSDVHLNLFSSSNLRTNQRS